MKVKARTMNNRAISTTLSISLFLLLVGSQMFAPSRAFACFCGFYQESDTYDKFIDKNDAVFLGKAISMKYGDGDPISGFLIGGDRKYLFQVGSSWKGIDQTEVIVTTGRGYGDCGEDFELGQTYLVYVRKDADGILNTGICSPNSRLVADGAELDFYGPSQIAKLEKGKYGRVVTEREISVLRPAQMPTRTVAFDDEFSILKSDGPYLIVLAIIVALLMFGLRNRSRKREIL